MSVQTPTFHTIYIKQYSPLTSLSPQTKPLKVSRKTEFHFKCERCKSFAKTLVPCESFPRLRGDFSCSNLSALLLPSSCSAHVVIIETQQ